MKPYTGQRNLIVIASCRTGHNFIMNQVRHWDKENEIRISNQEDMMPWEFENRKPTMVANGKLLDFSLPTRVMIITRGFMNWLASYLMWISKGGTKEIDTGKIEKAIEIWEAQRREIYSTRKRICAYQIGVNYQFFQDWQPYRRVIADQLNLEMDDGRIDEQATQGGKNQFCGSDTSQRYMEILKTPLKDTYMHILNRRETELTQNT